MSSRVSALMDGTGMHRDVERKGPSIILSNGKSLYFGNPNPRVMDPEMIGMALAKLCRWTGQCLAYFSVAQHCVLVSKIVPEEHAMAGLMHDASEAFIGDINRPLKYAMEQAAPGVLSGIEDLLHASIAKRFGFVFPFDPTVKEADNISLATEKRDILPDDGTPWLGMPAPLEAPLKPVGPRAAYTMWINRFEQLGGILG